MSFGLCLLLGSKLLLEELFLASSNNVLFCSAGGEAHVPWSFRLLLMYLGYTGHSRLLWSLFNGISSARGL